jgi:dipeptidyl aminopeptidase/acylaminoacyl peptidase
LEARGVAQFDGPFGDLSRFLEIPRLTGLALAPDGGTLVAGVQNLSPDGKKYVSSIWRIDVAGGAPVRLTRSAQGESAAAFLPDGSLLFTAKRDDPDAKKDDTASEGPVLWTLPAGGGEARLLAAPPAGVGAFAVARDSGTIVLAADVMPGAADFAEDAKLRKARKDADVTAILHEAAQVRDWDHQVGPDAARLFALTPPLATSSDRPELTDVTGDVGAGVYDHDVTPDGSAIVASWQVALPGGDYRFELVTIDVATGKRTTLVSRPQYDLTQPRVSPDGRWVMSGHEFHGDFESAHREGLWLQPLGGGEGRDPLPDFDLWPKVGAWSRDSSAFYFTADQLGHAPVFQLDLASGSVTRLTGDHGAYAQVRVAPDGTVYALRSAVDSPPRPVRLSSSQADQEPAYLAAPGDSVELPGRWEEVVVTAADGQPIHGRLVLPDLPEGSGPAPLLLWIHGGPHMSWNAWTWRWNPWVAASRGYAVLLPDPGLSDGYGQAFHNRGWGDWGGAPFTDLMAITDAVVARPDIDATRTAAMGGSFGGYMANWVATHTDRFKAIVSHAGLWHLELKATSDANYFFRREFGTMLEQPERWQRSSPHRSAADVRTPMLVIHGDRDYRVPLSNALWQWYDLQQHNVDAKFLYFPDENHWILRPQESKLWLETVFAFLAHQVLDEEWERPGLL